MGYELNEKIKLGLESGHNLIITGCAGSGKSENIKSILRDYGYCKNIALCSTTGISAVNIGGQTLHSFLNIGLCKTNDVEKEFKRIVNNPYSKWQQVIETDILIIDECSMLDGFLFTLIEKVLRYIRDNQNPYGGVQCVLFGDMLQLPPVQVEQNKYFFETEAYAFGNFKPIILKKIYRQKDKKFIEVLNRIRIGTQTPADIEYLNKRDLGNEINYATLDTTCLYPTNEEANKLNQFRLNRLGGMLYEFEADDIILKSQNSIFNYSKEVREAEEKRQKIKYNKVLRVPEILQLKKGARVILLYNVDVNKGLCNGTTGHFLRKEGNVLVCEFNGKEELIDKQSFEVIEKGETVFIRKQYPLRLGYAITIHSAQGMTLNTVAINFARTFGTNMVYVALSRCKFYEGLYLKNLDMDKIKIDNRVIEFMQKLEESEVSCG